VRYLILSDIHSNWEALQAVLEHARGRYDRILCCGDIVGYGADPNVCTEWARAKVHTIVRGNHDKACAGLDDLEWFNPVARTSALWTQQEVSAENIEYLRSLPKGPIEAGSFQLVHGSPLDEDDYLVNAREAAQLGGYVGASVTFFGHTHLQGGFELHRGGARRIQRTPEGADSFEVELEPDIVYLVNPGSVGQPRDGDPRAAYLLYTPARRLAEYRRVVYDIGKAQAKILGAGLPELLAWRLSQGT